VRNDFTFDSEKHVFIQHGQVVPSVTWVLARAGICDYSFLDEERSQFFKERGKSVHWLLQLEDEGLLDHRKVPKALRPYRKAYKTWKTRSGFVPLLIEHKFVSPFGFSGILDRYGKQPINAVLDFKTGSAAEWVKYQLAAYALAIQPKIALARMIRRIALALLPDGTYKVKEFPMSEFDHDIARFLEALKETQ